MKERQKKRGRKKEGKKGKRMKETKKERKPMNTERRHYKNKDQPVQRP